MLSKIMKVFIVDDAEAIRERLTLTLSEIKGIQIVGEAQDSREARHRIPLQKPDAVILDLQLPDENGRHLIPWLKGLPKPPVILVLTNYDFPQYREACLKAGAEFFFDKSREFNRVTQVLKQILQDDGSGELLHERL